MENSSPNTVCVWQWLGEGLGDSVYSDTRCRESPSAWGTEYKKHVHVSFILNNGSHSPVVPILLIARGDGPKKLDSENGNFVLCSKGP